MSTLIFKTLVLITHWQKLGKRLLWGQWCSPGPPVVLIHSPFITARHGVFSICFSNSPPSRETAEGRIVSSCSQVTWLSHYEQNSDLLGVFDLCPDVKVQGRLSPGTGNIKFTRELNSVPRSRSQSEPVVKSTKKSCRGPSPVCCVSLVLKLTCSSCLSH